MDVMRLIKSIYKTYPLIPSQEGSVSSKSSSFERGLRGMLSLVFLLTSLFSFAQFGDLASVQVEIEKEKEDVYELKFILNLKEGAYTYVYSDDPLAPPAFEVFLDSSDRFVSIGDWKYPKHKTKYLEELEAEVNYFEGSAFILSKKIKVNSEDFTVYGNFQGQVCEEGKCIPTQYPNPTFQFTIGKGSSALVVENTEEKSTSAEKEVNSNSEAWNYDFSKEKNELKTFNGEPLKTGISSSFIETFLLAFVFGLGALLTPCVFPMIPMTVSFFLKGNESKSKGKGIAIIFGVSIIVIYCIIGTLFSVLFGEDSANLIATHWIPNLFFFGIFIFFAASFFGMFEITLPSSWSNKSDQKADKGGVGGAMFMALTLSLVSFSCTGPIIGTVLVQSVKVGGLEPLVGMLGFSSAFALPFTLFAFFPSMLKNLPKSGGWLNSVKVVFGFLELALALKFLSIADQTQHWGILDREVFLALWIVIFSLLGFYLLGKLKFSHDSDLPFLKVPRFLLAIFSFSFVVYLLPGMWGAPLRSLSGYLPPMSTMDFKLGASAEDGNEICGEATYSDKLHLPHGLKGYFDYEEGMNCAKEQGKPVFIDFTGLSCQNCRKVEEGVWSDPVVLEILKNDFVIISLFGDDHTLKLKKPYTAVFNGEKQIETVGQKAADIQKTWFGLFAQPYYVTMDNNKELLQIPIDYQVAEEKNDFLKFLQKSLKEYKKRKQ